MIHGVGRRRFLQLIDPRELKGGVKKMGRPIPFRDFTGVLKGVVFRKPGCVEVIDSHPFPNEGKGWGTHMIGDISGKGG